ncbi:MAG: exodeoxyribonuclease VII large subunit [Sporolactobacillus sp.]
MPADRYLSVTRLTRYIKQKMETDRSLQNVWLKGEISNFKRHSRGHLYLTLKDNNARIKAVMFASSARQLAFEPADGMKVLVQGSISLYEPYGEYQIYIRQMEQDGLGRLYLAYEALKKKLQAKGWFDPSYKKPIPRVSYEIGLITSPTGAVIRDLFVTIKRRFPAARLTVFPVLVQGAEAAPSLVQAIRQANRNEALDLLIVGRGGGSIEDLWPFNEESVAAAIFESRLPIISAVGHETDFTIADFVADKRAPTPTAAGEFAVPDYRELYRQIDNQRNRLIQSIRSRVNRQSDRLRRLRQAYAFKYPQQLVLQKQQQLDQLLEDLQKAMLRLLRQKAEHVVLLNRLMQKSSPSAMLNQSRRLLEEKRRQLLQSMLTIFRKKQAESDQLIVRLNALSPLAIMSRGYSLAYTEEEKLIKSVHDAVPGDPLILQLHDGRVDCQIWGIEEEKQ